MTDDREERSTMDSKPQTIEQGLEATLQWLKSDGAAIAQKSLDDARAKHPQKRSKPISQMNLRELVVALDEMNREQ